MGLHVYWYLFYMSTKNVDEINGKKFAGQHGVCAAALITASWINNRTVTPEERFISRRSCSFSSNTSLYLQRDPRRMGYNLPVSALRPGEQRPVEKETV